MPALVPRQSETPYEALPPLAQQLRDTLSAKGLTQQQAADHLGVTLKTVSRWANGHEGTKQSTALQMALRLLAALPDA